MSSIVRFARMAQTPIRLNTLHRYSQNLNTERMIPIAQFMKNEVSIRIAKRVESFHNIPWELAMDRSISEVKNLYLDSFNRLKILFFISYLKNPKL